MKVRLGRPRRELDLDGSVSSHAELRTKRQVRKQLTDAIPRAGKRRDQATVNGTGENVGEMLDRRGSPEVDVGPQDLSLWETVEGGEN
jgi:hypothetical protein